jgi:hypothetical protein
MAWRGEIMKININNQWRNGGNSQQSISGINIESGSAGVMWRSNQYGNNEIMAAIVMAISWQPAAAVINDNKYRHHLKALAKMAICGVAKMKSQSIMKINGKAKIMYEMASSIKASIST